MPQVPRTLRPSLLVLRPNTDMTADENARRVPTPSDTPRTDAADDRGDGLVEAGFARTLEQENADLRAELVDAQKTIHEALTYFHDSGGRSMVAGDTIPQMFNALTDEMDDAKTERDDARKEAATLRELAEGLAKHGSEFMRIHLFQAIAIAEHQTDPENDELAGRIGQMSCKLQDAQDAFDALAARYRAACPGEGQTSNPSNSPTASREIHG
jgi:hypothetical protein